MIFAYIPTSGILPVVLAALISYGAGSLACGLAGCLALAASALLHRFVQRLRVQCLNMLHLNLLLMIVKYDVKHLAGRKSPPSVPIIAHPLSFLKSFFHALYRALLNKIHHCLYHV